MPFELTDLSGNSPQIYEGYWSVCKTLNNLLLAEIILIDNLLPRASDQVVAL